MNSWELKALDLEARLPEILSSSEEARAIVLDLAAGESLSDHEVHERAWLLVIDGAIEVTTAAGERASGEAGLLAGLVVCQATFAVLMSRLRRGLSVLRLRQWMYRRMRRAWVAWSGWSVPASVKYRSARNCASIRFSQEA